MTPRTKAISLGIGLLLVAWIAVGLGGGLVTLLLMKECADEWEELAVVAIPILWLMLGVPAIVRGRSAGRVIAVGCAIAFVAYAAIAWWCQLPDDVPRALTEPTTPRALVPGE